MSPSSFPNRPSPPCFTLKFLADMTLALAFSPKVTGSHKKVHAINTQPSMPAQAIISLLKKLEQSTCCSHGVQGKGTAAPSMHQRTHSIQLGKMDVMISPFMNPLHSMPYPATKNEMMLCMDRRQPSSLWMKRSWRPWQRKTRAFGEEEEVGSHLHVKSRTPLEFLMYSCHHHHRERRKDQKKQELKESKTHKQDDDRRSLAEIRDIKFWITSWYSTSMCLATAPASIKAWPWGNEWCGNLTTGDSRGISWASEWRGRSRQGQRNMEQRHGEAINIPRWGWRYTCHQYSHRRWSAATRFPLPNPTPIPSIPRRLWSHKKLESLDISSDLKIDSFIPQLHRCPLLFPSSNI